MKYTYKYLEDSWIEHCKYLEDSWIEGCLNFVQSYVYNDLDDSAISYFPTIIPSVIETYSDKKWDWCNTMEKDKENWINNHRLQIIKALQIQRHWRNCVSNPEYKLAQKLINLTFKKS